MTEHLAHVAPGVWGGTLTIMAAIVSFFSHALPLLQGIASCVAIVAGVATVASVIRHWQDE